MQMVENIQRQLKKYKTVLLLQRSQQIALLHPSSEQERKQQTLDLHINNADVMKAEIIWILKSICSGYSNRSCEQLNCTLKAMFPDSKILEAFSMRRTKSMYMINHGLVPFLSHFCDLS